MASSGGVARGLLATGAARLVQVPQAVQFAVPRRVVPFRFAPEGVRRRDLDDLNERLGRAVLDDGRVAVGLTRYRSVVCLRPAIANWRTGEEDVRLVVEVVRELGARLLR